MRSSATNVTALSGTTRRMNFDYQPAATLMDAALREIAGCDEPARTKVLDLGAGTGTLVRELRVLGYDARGCDVSARWEETNGPDRDRFSLISLNPYHLPYEDGTFDAVISTSVLEHAQNKEEVFREIRRVLRKSGWSMHLFPGKWYLPSEPHIYVPLVNWFWPRVPRWWLALWALAGIRNEYQQGMPWREVVDANAAYSRSGLSYLSHGAYRELSMRIFGNYASRDDFFILRGYGGVQRILSRFPFPKLTGWITGRRMSFMVEQKT
jgi:SAM-dependent methyltransferase